MNRLMTGMVCLILTLFVCNVQAKEVKPETAKLVAENFAKQMHKNKTDGLTSNTAVALLATSNQVLKGGDANSSQSHLQGDAKPNYYIFSLNPGWCIIAGDDNAMPVVAYSPEDNFDVSNIPENALYWFELYDKEIASVRSDNASSSVAEVANAWEKYLSESGNSPEVLSVIVAPLIKTKWNQRSPYNNLCPTWSGERCVTGCVATAMAQLMKYWEYPETGAGYSYYTSKTHGFSLYADYGETEYDWSNMTNEYNYSSSSTEESAVAQLMYHCGIALEMDYDPDGSVANSGKIAYALKNYFSYDNSCQFVFEEDYDYSSWKSLLKTELNNSRPMGYSGHPYDNSTGHSFVCDGYDSDDKFHFNFGWGGYCDGYYYLSSLIPGTGGTGSGNGNYSYYQAATIGVKPPVGATAKLNVYDVFELTNTPAINGQIKLNINFLNVGKETFNGIVRMKLYTDYIYDGSAKYVRDLGTIYVDDLPVGYRYTNSLSFTSDYLYGLKPGAYTIIAFYQHESAENSSRCGWQTSSLHHLSIDLGEFNGGSELTFYDEPTLDRTVIRQGDDLTYSVQLTNESNNDFSGTLQARVFKENTGMFDSTKVMDYITNFYLQSGYRRTTRDEFSFITAYLDTGTYYISLSTYNSGSDYSYWVNSGEYTHSLVFTVLPAILADEYEPNNTKYSISNKSVINSSDCRYNSLGFDATIHKEDTDWYKVVFPAGYNYKLSPSAIDGYNFPELYNCDVKFKVYYNGTDSTDWIDSDLENSGDSIIVKNGGDVYVQVIPYYEEDRGTYEFYLEWTADRYCEPDEYEPNNSFETAAYVPLSIDGSDINIDANLHSGTDVDYYKIYFDPGKKYEISVSYYDPNKQIWSPNCKTSTDGYDWSTNNYKTLEDGGYLYIYVDYDNIGTYGLTVSYTATEQVTADKYEPNNTFEDASPLTATIGEYNIYATLHESEDVDYYKIYFAKGKKYKVDIFALDKYSTETAGRYSVDVEYRVFADNVWSGTYGAAADSIILDDGGYIYLKVKGYEGEGIGTYCMNVQSTIESGVEDAKQSGPNFFIVQKEGSGTAVLMSFVEGAIAENFTVYDLSGRILLDERNISGNFAFDVSKWTHGKYFVKLDFGGKTEIIDFVK